MAEEFTAGPGPDEGQSDLGSGGNQTTEADPGAVAGQSTDQTTQMAGTDDTFFDPRDIADDPKLMAAYKNMQSAFSKKMQGISESRQKIEAYDAFYQNPIEQVQRIAQQYGYQLSPAQAQNIAQNQAGQPNPGGDDWQPNNWNEVMERATQIAEQKILEKMNPVLSQVQNMRKESIESQLSKIDPTWQQYEDEMKQTLQKHPTLSNDPANLYRMSVPSEVLESRATQAALRKMEDRQASAQISGKSTTSKSPGVGLPDKPVSFSDAVKAAKQSLSEQGIRREG